MINFIQERYDDSTFAIMFDFLKKNLNNDKLITMFNMLKDNIYEFDGDILNMFY